MCWLYLLKQNSEVSYIFEKIYSMIRNQHDTSIKILRTDNDSEYFNYVLNQFLSNHGLLYYSSCVDSPKQNGVSERKNNHILEVAIIYCQCS